jgi:glycosyltransferase involved in cell wall biosynthesis
MRISVVIPAHNEEKCIANTIKAVLAQDHKDFEVIVVDNSSNDRTSEIVSTFPVKLVHEHRKGLLMARECGRLNANGEIIANIDADCLPDTSWLSRGEKHFLDEKVAAVTGPYDYYDGQWMFRYVSLLLQKNLYFLMNLVLQFSFIKKGAVLIGGNNFIRSATISKAGGYNTSIKFYGEDTDTARRVLEYGRVVFDRKLNMKTSARRFKNEGVINITWKYIYHFFKIILAK